MGDLEILLHAQEVEQGVLPGVLAVGDSPTPQIQTHPETFLCTSHTPIVPLMTVRPKAGRR
jgi:hypothetical protein